MRVPTLALREGDAVVVVAVVAVPVGLVVGVDELVVGLAPRAAVLGSINVGAEFAPVVGAGGVGAG